jgi:pyrroloquinoline quinone biosynthesis protein B
VILVDATPDLRSQAADLRDASGLAAAPGLPVDAILLTHAHIGHYTGLMYLGRESMAARAVPVLATPRMAAFLKSNRPWSRLVEWGHVSLGTIEPGSRRALAPGIEVEAIAVPHRNEDADTIGFLLRGPAKRLLYVPDTDAWERWPRPLASILEEVDVAILDGTFFDSGEIPGRDASLVPHPLMRSTMDLLAGTVAVRRCLILFTHLNHTNPALDPLSPEAASIRAAGLSVAEEGMEFAL